MTVEIRWSRAKIFPLLIQFSPFSHALSTPEYFQLRHCLRLFQIVFEILNLRGAPHSSLSRNYTEGTFSAEGNFSGWFCRLRTGHNMMRWCEISTIGVQLTHQPLNLHLSFFFNQPSTPFPMFWNMFIYKSLLKYLGLMVLSCLSECPSRLWQYSSSWPSSLLPRIVTHL